MSNMVCSGDVEVNVAKIRSVSGVRDDAHSHQCSDFAQDFYTLQEAKRKLDKESILKTNMRFEYCSLETNQVGCAYPACKTPQSASRHDANT